VPHPLSIFRYPNEMNLEIVLAVAVQPATTHRLLVANATSKKNPPPEGEGFEIPEGDVRPLELRMDAGSKKVDRPTVAIKARIRKELVIRGDSCRGRQLPTVIGLEDLLGSTVSQLSVADK
jgi:hypothetical protein